MKKIPALLLEIILVVFLVITLVVLGVEKYNDLFNSFPKYTIQFKDVDALSVGSPVRLAGVHIGHVIKQEFKDNNILVTFKVTNKNTSIPKGSVAGIEFTGLGGSKSLEIMPPHCKQKSNQEIYQIEPVRVNSFMEIQNTISKSTLDLCNGILSFLNKSEKDASINLRKTANTLHENTANLKEIHEKIKTKGEETIEETKKIKSIIQDTNKNLTHLNTTLTNMNEFEKDKNVQSSINKIKDSTKDLSNFMESEKFRNLNQNINQVNRKLTRMKDKEIRYINEFSESLKTATEKMQKFVDSLKKKEKKEETHL
ncbi:MAG: hypothetical protein A2Y25_08280 [Candidatus Melainabacteria bacterium GWF2_37_15]|nr:MAG: hypothetical protein A2Y25_08280 [Candidatus Melainabacteria bacterium GWF2_37_15]